MPDSVDATEHARERNRAIPEPPEFDNDREWYPLPDSGLSVPERQYRLRKLLQDMDGGA